MMNYYVCKSSKYCNLLIEHRVTEILVETISTEKTVIRMEQKTKSNKEIRLQIKINQMIFISKVLPRTITQFLSVPAPTYSKRLAS